MHGQLAVVMVEGVLASFSFVVLEDLSSLEL